MSWAFFFCAGDEIYTQGSDHRLTEEGKARILRAFLYISIGHGDRGEATFTKLLEQSQTLGINRQKNAVALMAPDVAALESNADFAIGADVSRAMAEFMDFVEMKKLGKVKSIEEFYNQMDLLDAPSEIAKEILLLLGSKQSAADMAEYIRQYCDAAMQEDPTGGLLGADAARTRTDIWRDAKRTVDERRAKAAETEKELAAKRHSVVAADGKNTDAFESWIAKGNLLYINKQARKESARWLQLPGDSTLRARNVLTEKDFTDEQLGRIISNSAAQSQEDASEAFDLFGTPRLRHSVGAVTPEEDAKYADAVKRGDMKTARRMEREVYERMGYSDDSSYQGTSAFNGAAPSRNAYFETKAERIEATKNGEMEDTTTLGDYRDGIDVNNLQFIVFDPRSERNANPMRQEAIRNIRGVLDSGAKTITMYRSVPADVKETQFRNGDWITPSRAYAEENAQIHGWGDKFRVIEQEVSVEDVWWDGNDIAEWGFDDGRGSVYKNTAANRKLLGPTYDDAGNLIPLSKRFNDRKNDVRYSIAAQPAGRNKVAGVAYPDAGEEISEIRFSIGAKRREKYARVLAKHRPDLRADAVLGELEKFDDTKKEKVALHWIVSGGLELPEDAYKVDDAISVAEKAKVDPFRYRSPDELMLANKEFKPSAKPINPDTVPELSDRRDEGDGVVSYQVQDDRAGQAAMRRIIDTHWGEDANPWCLLARHANQPPELWRAAAQLFPHNPDAQWDYVQKHTPKGDLERAWDYWQNYNALPKRVAFKNGKLLAFMATHRNSFDDMLGNDIGIAQDRLFPEWRDGYNEWKREAGRDAWRKNYNEWLEENHPNWQEELYYALEEEPVAEEWWDRKDESHTGHDGLMEIAGAKGDIRYSLSAIWDDSLPSADVLADGRLRAYRMDFYNGASLNAIAAAEEGRMPLAVICAMFGAKGEHKYFVRTLFTDPDTLPEWHHLGKKANEVYWQNRDEYNQPITDVTVFAALNYKQGASDEAIRQVIGIERAASEKIGEIADRLKRENTTVKKVKYTERVKNEDIGREYSALKSEMHKKYLRVTKDEWDALRAKKAELASKMYSWRETQTDRTIKPTGRELQDLLLKDAEAVATIDRAKKDILAAFGRTKPVNRGIDTEAGEAVLAKLIKSTRRYTTRYSISGIYTGSAADYDRPSLHAVGTGEGSQVYGWGLYGSTVRGVAETYMDDAVHDPRGLAKNFLEIHKTKDAAIKAIKKGLKQNAAISDELKNTARKAIKILQSGKSIPDTIGNLYEQTFFTDREPGDESHLLKWYRPVEGDQRKWIEDALQKENLVTPEAWGAPRADGAFYNYTGPIISFSSGDSLYRSLSKILGSPRAASEFLARAGIDGVKYPVDSFGGKTLKNGDEVGWNYVSFRDDNIRIDHKWTDGVQRFSVTSLGGYGGRLRVLAHGVKEGDEDAMNEAAGRMAALIPDNAVLIPIPSHTGKATTMLQLANAMQSLKPSATVLDALEADPHESNYVHKKRLHRPPDAVSMRMKEGIELPQGRPVYFVDNVVASGVTYAAAQKAIPGADIATLTDTGRRKVHPIPTLEELEAVVRQKKAQHDAFRDQYEKKPTHANFEKYTQSLMEYFDAADALNESRRAERANLAPKYAAPDGTRYATRFSKFLDKPISEELNGIISDLAAGIMVPEKDIAATPEWREAMERAKAVEDSIFEKYGVRSTLAIKTPERLAMQDNIVEAALSPVITRTVKVEGLETPLELHEKLKDGESYTVARERKACIVTGLPAAGKSSVFANPIALEMKARICDSDAIKRVLPEFDNGYGGNAVHEESTEINEKKVLEAASDRGDNIVYPILGYKPDKLLAIGGSPFFRA